MSEREELDRYVEKLVQPRDPAETKEWYTEWANKYDKVSDQTIVDHSFDTIAHPKGHLTA